MYSALPKQERSFDLKVTGGVTGHEYAGTFTVRCVLNIGQKHAIELEKSRLLSDQRNPTNGLASIAVTLAEIHGRTVEAPAWWKDSNAGADLLDEDVIFAIFDKCLELEDQWKAELKAKGQEAASKNAQTVTQ
jgi:hypothetical protein